MYLDLEASEDDLIVILDIENRNSKSYIRLTDLLYGGLTLLASYPVEYHSKIDEYRKRIESYLFSVISLKEATLDVATEVFTVSMSGENH